MLRASVDKTDQTVDLLAITTPNVDSLIPHGRELLAFSDAIVAGFGDLETARASAVAAVGERGAVRAAAVVANFEMMNRILDATGIPVPNRIRAIAPALGLTDLDLH